MQETSCQCLNQPLAFEQYEQVKFVGVDETDGRFGQVSIWRCRRCGRQWLHYLIEDEAFAGSGRFFMGLLTPEAVDTLTASTAIEYLNQLNWHLYGGSYFGGRKGWAVGKVNL